MIPPSFDDIQRLSDELNHQGYLHWFQDDLFAFNWWLLLSATVLPYFIWWRIVDKNRLIEISALGLFSAISASFFDLIGTTLGLWGYPDKLIPVLPPLLPADLVVIPICSMIIYQYSHNLFSYLWRYVILSLFLAYVIEVAFSDLGMYIKLKWWTHTYSFFGLCLYGISLRLFMNVLLKNDVKAK
ncbi:CBO0543 family protein [Metabacillus litoralis]|uniref:CBO0543 family protein n=1 Tax=Metabacillus litoralis TaxID=152268 RepID=UPI001CFD88D7|nr:CBO0543 family protein [Metabacillus litoralis]